MSAARSAPPLMRPYRRQTKVEVTKEVTHEPQAPVARAPDRPGARGCSLRAWPAGQDGGRTADAERLSAADGRDERAEDRELLQQRLRPARPGLDPVHGRGVQPPDAEAARAADADAPARD